MLIMPTYKTRWNVMPACSIQRDKNDCISILKITPGFTMYLGSHTKIALSVIHDEKKKYVHVKWLWDDLKITDTTYSKNFIF